jgi:hypothetical protein
MPLHNRNARRGISPVAVIGAALPWPIEPNSPGDVFMNKIALLTTALLAATAMSAADSRVIKSRDGGCQIMVPSDWTPGALGGTADAPDTKSSAAVSSPKAVDSFDQLKQTAQAIYRGSKVTKDSATEFEMEGKSITDKPNVYRAIPIAGGKFCASEVMYENGDAAQARKLAGTLSASK